MTNPNGAFVYDIPDEAAGIITAKQARNARVLGKAVHPKALARLHELWPDAIVKVYHDRVGRGPKYPQAWHYVRRTRVHIIPSTPGGAATATGEVVCHSEDTFNRRRGIELAFRRELKAVPQ